MSDSGDDALDKARELDNQWEHYMGADKPQSPPAGDELGEILTDCIEYEPCNTRGCSGKCHQAKLKNAKAQLNAYMLAQFMDLIGEDVIAVDSTLTIEIKVTETVNKLKALQRKAAQARFGKDTHE
jgi:hypothetical protein